jgi:hypothetical protein
MSALFALLRAKPYAACATRERPTDDRKKVVLTKTRQARMHQPEQGEGSQIRLRNRIPTNSAYGSVEIWLVRLVVFASRLRLRGGARAWVERPLE